MKNILVLCEGNICRSPMAEALLSRELPGLTVRSAGLGALSGYPADATAIRLMAELGLDISAHRAVQVTREMCLQSDLIFVMETEQRHRLEAKFPAACGRIFRLCESRKADVPDPYRQPEEAFRSALGLIEVGSAAWRERIQKILKVSA